MGKSIAILLAGVLILFMGLRSFSGYDSEIEHLFAGRTVTVVCRDGKPYQGEGLHMHAAVEKCAEERRKQSSSVRILLAAGVGLVAWAAFDINKART